MIQTCGHLRARGHAPCGPRSNPVEPYNNAARRRAAWIQKQDRYAPEEPTAAPDTKKRNPSIVKGKS
jgi:hypothetical protein